MTYGDTPCLSFELQLNNNVILSILQRMRRTKRIVAATWSAVSPATRVIAGQLIWNVLSMKLAKAGEAFDVMDVPEKKGFTIPTIFCGGNTGVSVPFSLQSWWFQREAERGVRFFVEECIIDGGGLSLALNVAEEVYLLRLPEAAQEELAKFSMAELHSPWLRVLRVSGLRPQSLLWLSSFPKIEVLDLEFCAPLTDISFLRSLHILTALSLRGTAVTSASIEILGECPMLTRVDLSKCPNVTDTHPLARIKCLNVLSLGYCENVLDVNCLSSCELLERLQLTEASIPTSGIVGLRGCGRLKDLDLNGCRFIDDVNFLAECTFLERLDVSGTHVSTPGISALAHCANLRELCIQGCSRVNSVNFLSACGHLEHLSAGLTPLTTTGVAGLGQCAKLCELRLRNCKGVDSVNFLAACKRLELLILDNTSVTTAGISRISQCTELKKLYLGGCSGVHDVNFLGRCRLLELLVLDGTSVSTIGIMGLARCKRLRELYLSECKGVIDVNFLWECTSLERVDLSFSSVSSVGLTGLVRCRHLREVSLTGCDVPREAWSVLSGTLCSESC